MKRLLSLILLAAVFIAIVASRGKIKNDTRQKMREQSSERSGYNLGIVIDHAKKDLTELATNTAERIKEGYDEYAPTVKEKGSDIFSGIAENAPDIAKSYVEHQSDFISETIDRIKEDPTATEEEPEPAAPEGVVLEGPFDIAWTVDGDTIAIINGTDKTYVRFIGIDCPESRASDDYLARTSKSNTDEGKQSSAFSKEMFEKTGMRVWLEKDVEDTDLYGRLLRYVYVNIDGELKMMNEILLEEGMARMATIAPNVKYSNGKFKEAQQRAIEARKGFWDSGFFKEEE